MSIIEFKIDLILIRPNILIILVIVKISNALRELLYLVIRGRGVEVWVWSRVDYQSLDVLCDVAMVFMNKPATHINIIEHQARARVASVASDDARG